MLPRVHTAREMSRWCATYSAVSVSHRGFEPCRCRMVILKGAWTRANHRCVRRLRRGAIAARRFAMCPTDFSTAQSPKPCLPCLPFRKLLSMHLLTPCRQPGDAPHAHLQHHPQQHFASRVEQKQLVCIGLAAHVRLYYRSRIRSASSVLITKVGERAPPSFSRSARTALGTRTPPLVGLVVSDNLCPPRSMLGDSAMFFRSRRH
jgi:hypothetical protein